MAGCAPESVRAMREGRPVFLWAPVGRCGTGLLQRLVTSSREIFLFGEDRYLLRSLPQLLIARARLGPQSDADRQRLEIGDYSRWSPGVLADSQLYSAALIQGFAGLCGAYAETARRAGFPRWGAKLPEFHPQEAAVLAQLLPRAQHLFVYRHVDDVLASCKARRWIQSPADLRSFATRWATGVQHALSELARDSRYLVIRYETLLEQRESELARLCSFLGLRGVDAGVFGQRVNTWQGREQDGHSASQYIAPAGLDDAERALARELAGDALCAAGYASATSA